MSLPSLKALIPTKQIGLVVEHATHAAAVTKAVVASQPVADTLQTAAQVIGEGVTDNATKAAAFASDHPFATAAIVGGAFLVAVPGAVVAPVLGAAGFTANGVAAGSAAAAAQSGIGSVAAGSGFATLQSAAAGGYGVALVNGVVQGAGAAVSLGGAAMNYMRKKP